MKSTYILVLKWSLMPWKDLRLAVFMFVRIMYLKEKGRSVDYDRSPHFHRFDLVESCVYIQCKVFS